MIRLWFMERRRPKVVDEWDGFDKPDPRIKLILLDKRIEHLKKQLAAAVCEKLREQNKLE